MLLNEKSVDFREVKILMQSFSVPWRHTARCAIQADQSGTGCTGTSRDMHTQIYAHTRAKTACYNNSDNFFALTHEYQLVVLSIHRGQLEQHCAWRATGPPKKFPILKKNYISHDFTNRSNSKNVFVEKTLLFPKFELWKVIDT